MCFPIQKNPTKRVRVRELAKKSTHYQLSARRICLAEWTRQGSAYVGELRILRENSFDEAMTMKLAKR
jgi:hypothetical protein